MCVYNQLPGFGFAFSALGFGLCRLGIWICDGDIQSVNVDLFISKLSKLLVFLHPRPYYV